MLGHEGLKSGASLNVVPAERGSSSIGMLEVTLVELELQVMEAADAGVVIAPAETITQLVKEDTVAVDKVNGEDPQKADY